MFNYREAENLLRCFKTHNPALNIIVEYARDRDRSEYKRPVQDYEFLDKKSVIKEDKPLRNVPEVNKRCNKHLTIFSFFSVIFDGPIYELLRAEITASTLFGQKYPINSCKCM